MLTSVIAATVLRTGVAVTQMLKVWFDANIQGSVLALAFLARPIRAVGPLVAVFMIAAVAGALSIVVAVGRNDQALTGVAWIGTQLHLGVAGTSALLLLTGAMATGIAGWMLLRWIGALYRGRWISDQSILVDAVWLMFTIEYGISLMQLHPLWLLAAVAAFAAFKSVVWTGFRLLKAAATSDDDAPKLLLLRVFSLGVRSERLFESLAKHWRYHGSIRLIAGPDLVRSTVEPNQFLDFLAGHLQQNFINGPAALDHRLAESEPRRNFDGRFRTASFFCHDDTWQMTLRKLAKISDAVLMDLRGFSRGNRGCLFEIEELLEVVALDRILFVVDHTTDETFLAEVFAGGWKKVTAASPNWTNPARRIHILRLDDHISRNVPKLVALLAKADLDHAPLTAARA